MFKKKKKSNESFSYLLITSDKVQQQILINTSHFSQFKNLEMKVDPNAVENLLQLIYGFILSLLLLILDWLT